MVLEPALVVPDDLSWTLWGADPYAEGLLPVSAPGSARRVLLPDRLPEPLAAALRRLSRELPADRRTEVRSAAVLGGPPLERVLAGTGGQGGAGDPGSHGEGHERDGHGESEDRVQEGQADHEHEDHGHEGHGDMMAITGSPGSDGLVMEPLDTTLGPLGGPLPGGLAVSARLAGDVVEACRVEALLEAEGRPPDRPPDALAPAAWTAALGTAGGQAAAGAWRGVAAVELERAVSHVAWLRSLARLLGWSTLVEACTAALGPLGAARRGTRDGLPAESDLHQGLDAVAALGRAVRGRRMRARTRGRAVVGAATVAEHGLFGPVARAAGVARDAREDDPAYAALGFAAVLEADGDARARTVLRHAEALAAVEMAVAALAHDRARHPGRAFGDGAGGALVEGPRGPLRARPTGEGLHLEAPGAQALRALAAGSAVGEEWAGALVCLASFDLSPWRVGEQGARAGEHVGAPGGP